MKKITMLLVAAMMVSGLSEQSFAQISNLGKTGTQSKPKMTTGNTIPSSSNNLSQNEVAKGLKEALTLGAQNASSKLSATNGFFGNNLIKILLPAEVRQAESMLRNVGLGSIVDKAILSMNRAAEQASAKAVPIFVSAITGMSIQDGLGILKGGNGAATNYLQQRTTLELTNAFRPVIDNALRNTGATAYWNQLFTAYNKLPLRQKVNADLTSYVTEKALNGLFITIADEENKIRTNPASRVSDILQKVFGGL